MASRGCSKYQSAAGINSDSSREPSQAAQRKTAEAIKMNHFSRSHKYKFLKQPESTSCSDSTLSKLLSPRFCANFAWDCAAIFHRKMFVHPSLNPPKKMPHLVAESYFHFRRPKSFFPQFVCSSLRHSVNLPKFVPREYGRSMALRRRIDRARLLPVAPNRFGCVSLVYWGKHRLNWLR